MARTVIFGRSGAGKSWFAGWYLERVVGRFDYAVHFDIEDEEQGLSQRGESLLKSFYVDDEFFNKRVEYEGREMPLAHAVILHNRSVRVVPDGLTPSEQRELFAEICALAMKIGKTDSTIHVSADEAQTVIPDGGELDERVERMLTGGRKKGVEWMFTTQRPANLHEEAFTQANYGYYFSLSRDTDIARVNGSSNINAYKILPTLDPREYIMEDLDNGEITLGSSEELQRRFPHMASDDGVADEAAEAAAELGGQKKLAGEGETLDLEAAD